MDSLKEFVAALRMEGLARNSKFAIEISLPTGMKENFQFSYKLRTILLFCDSTTLPGVSIATTPNRSFGEVRETPYEKLFDSLHLSFYVDNSMVVKSLFDEWSNVIQNMKTREFSYYSEYITKITITTFDLQGRPRYRMQLHEAYPKQIGTITLDYSNKDIMKLGVGFVFKYWDTIELAPVGYGPDKTPNIFNQIGAAINNTVRSVLQIPQTYLNDFAGFQQQYSSLGNSVENGGSTLFGDTKGIYTGTGSRLM